VKAQIIGLPLSLSHKGYFGDLNKVLEAVKKRKGLKIILNADEEIIKGGRTLSTFVFGNRFENFDDYLNKLRSPYRRRINKALKCRNKLRINKIRNRDFNEDHYRLYLSIMKRTDNPLETLPIEFFQEYEAEIYEFTDKDTREIVGFIQLKEFDGRLCFMFGGFNKADVKKYDLYYNMLLKIVETSMP
jgi:predicted N-acyltransferase